MPSNQGDGIGVAMGEWPPKRILDSFDLAGVAKYVKDGKAKRIICLCGAGISVSAGIPDFRSPDTGLYCRLQRYNLPHPEAMFTISYFKQNPEPFHMVAKELYPGRHKPTPTHYFISLLEKKGLLLKCFTQNIDSLETLAGLPKDKVIAAHGNFDSASCIKCHKSHDTEWVRETVFAGNICRCRTPSCGGLVKPDIIFFEERTTATFDVAQRQAFPQCDLLIVMGTSLMVEPFAGLLCKVGTEVPRLLINREPVGTVRETGRRKSPRRSVGFQFDPELNYRDAQFLGECDAGVRELADHLGWKEELEQLIADGHSAVEVTGQQQALAMDE